MKTLSIGVDISIVDNASDVYARMLLYAPLVDEMYIHCIHGRESIVKEMTHNAWIYTCTSWWKSLVVIYKIIKNKKIDVIISPDPFAKGWVAMIFACLCRKKLLLSVYGGNIFDPHWKGLSLGNRLYAWIGRIVFWYATAIQTDGKETYDELKARYGNKVFWKPMIPANREELLVIERNDLVKNDKPRILYIGRLIEQKNIPFLVRVINAVKDKAYITVVGYGPLKSLLPMNSIHYFPVLNRKEIVEQFRQADMLILTSYYEGFARVMMEAALAGIPIVTTRVSGVQGLIQHEHTGYVLSQGDEQGCIDAVEMLITHPDKRCTMGKAIRAHAQHELSIEMMLEKQKEVYDFLKQK